MERSIGVLKRELEYINRRIVLIRKGNINIDRGITLKEALAWKADLEKAIAVLKTK
jgi:hypothetical protein